jgi:hypothetical protein
MPPSWPGYDFSFEATEVPSTPVVAKKEVFETYFYAPHPVRNPAALLARRL